jgi:hypothetical protein
VQAVQSRKISLRTFLEAASGIEVLEDRVRIAFGPRQGFFRESLTTEESLAILREAARDATGSDLSIEIAAEAPAAGPAAEAEAGGTQGRRERLIQQALSRPGVRRLMEAFGGQIVDIREGG